MLPVFAALVAASTAVLIFAGGLVTSTGSGLAVPDWTTTYGENMFLFPPSKWVGGIFYEHGHRLIASTVGMLTIVLAAWIWKADPRRWMKRLGLAALAAVILQGRHEGRQSSAGIGQVMQHAAAIDVVERAGSERR